jgi:undecaprenyl-diphosphatase
MTLNNHIRMYSFWYHFLIQLDHKLFFIINHLHHPWGDILVHYGTHSFTWIPLYGLLLYLILKAFRERSWQPVSIIICLIILCDQFASGLVKPWVQRLRPCLDPDLSSSIHVVGAYHGLYGFISSHAANTFGIATFLYLLLSKKYPSIKLLFIWAFFISYARIYGGVHYPLDVILGALSGIGWANLMFISYLLLSRFIPCNYQAKRNGTKRG